MSLLSAITRNQWAITPDGLRTIVAVASRNNEDLKALAKEQGKRLDNTRVVSMRGAVACIPVEGPLFRKANLFQEISGAVSYQVLAQDITTALADKSAKALVLSINSPGGAVDGLNELCEMIFKARSQKRIVAFVEGMGCSAAYRVAAACDEIWADPEAIVGSVGVCATMYDDSEAMKMAGVEEVTIVSSNAPEKIHGYAGITKEAKDALLATLDGLEIGFVDSLARYRGVSADAVRANYGKGGVLIAGLAAEGQRTGLASGLVDRLGSFEDLVTQLNADAERDDMPLFQRTPPTTSAPASADAAQPPSAEDTMADKTFNEQVLTALQNLGASIAAQGADIAAISARITPVAPVATAEVSPEIESLVGATGAEAVGRVAALKQAADQLPGVKAELAALKDTLSARERGDLIKSGLESGKLMPAMKGWAEKTDIASLRSFIETAPAAQVHRELPTENVAGAGAPTVTADMIPTEAAQKHAFLMAQFHKLPEADRKQIKKSNGTDKDIAAYMERRIARSDSTGRVISRPTSVSDDR